MKKKSWIGLIAFFCMMNSFAFQLPSNFDAKTETDFNVSKNIDGTYKVYLKSYPIIELYKTKQYDLEEFSRTLCLGNDNMTGGFFSYRLPGIGNFKYETVFLNKKTKDVSPVYSGIEFLCPPQHEIMADADLSNKTSPVFLHPIFPSQPKSWIMIARHFQVEFPGLNGALSTFKENGNLLLVIAAEGDPQSGFTPAKTETIPIDYSLFEKPVNKPTCYTMPEDHKLRLCTKEEAKLRSPALKVFLGET